MHLIGVIDLRSGLAVHARGGNRDRYQPISHGACAPDVAGDAVGVARLYAERFGLTELYIADLDAIALRAGEALMPTADAAAGTRCYENALITALSRITGCVYLDAGITTVDHARAALALGASRVVVGLETLSSFSALEGICDAVGAQRVAFSLDLRAGVPLAACEGVSRDSSPPHLAAQAAASGAGTVIVIDLARVGTNTGLDLDLIRRIRAAIPETVLLTGGGVRHLEDLRRLAAAGCDGALVGTALHNGSLSAEDVRNLTRAASGRRPPDRSSPPPPSRWR